MRVESEKNNLFLIEDYIAAELSWKAERLFKHQIKNWKLASDNYDALKSVRVKKFEFDNFIVEAHFNPGRIISSSAKVDTKSISERPCFLCIENLPPEQKAVKALGDYIILVNPFPIFPEHFTLPSINHVPQLIESEFKNLLLLTKALGKDYTLFYNGPKCGASAPDHLHFQAGSSGFMKIDTEYDSIIKLLHSDAITGEIIYEENDLKIYLVTGYLRNFISLESNNIESLAGNFSIIYKLLNNGNKTDEPMMNIISNYDNRWRIIIFPRSRHRPSYFFEEGEKKIIISPAAVDLGGVLIFPREEDFEKVNKDLIIDIFRQVTISNEKMLYIADELKESVFRRHKRSSTV